MSLSVGSGYSNPYAYLQYLLQQNTSSSATAGQTIPALSPSAPSGTGTASSSSSSSNGALAGSSSVQFGPQTFFALLGLQMTGAGAAGFQFGADNATDTTGGSSGAQVQQGQFGPPPFGGLSSLLASADSGATAQTTTNANGSATYTITYADGSTVAVTTPAASSDASSSDSSRLDKQQSSRAAHRVAGPVVERELRPKRRRHVFRNASRPRPVCAAAVRRRGFAAGRR